MNSSGTGSGGWLKRWGMALSTLLAMDGAVLAQSPPPLPPTQQSPIPPQQNTQKPSDGVENAQFGELMELVVRPALTMKGKASWDDIYPELRQVFEKLNLTARQNGLTVSGPPIVRFANPDDDKADYVAMLPVAAMPPGLNDKLKPAEPGQTPGGRVIRFVHLGAYDTIGQTYEEASNLLEERRIQIEDAVVEEYIRDPETTREADLATFIYVFPKP